MARLTNPPSTAILAISIITIIIIATTTFQEIHAQRDLMKVGEKGLYVLPVNDKFGKQIVMGGVDPRTARPPHPTMCFTTPSNQETGSNTVTEAFDRLHYIAPAWFQLHLDTSPNPITGKTSLNVRITGQDNVDKTLLETTWKRWLSRSYTPKVTPRLSLQLTKPAIKLLLNPKAHVSIIESILELVHAGGLPRINSYKGFDGIVLEMPTVWTHLPPYPRDVVSFTEPKPNVNRDITQERNTPVELGVSETLQEENQRADDYGSFHYDFSSKSLDKHPRHIINQFVRKLGVALQSFDKALLVVAAPYQYQQDESQHFDPASQTANGIQSGANNNTYEDTILKKFDSLDCKKGDKIAFPQAFSHIDAYYLSPYVDYFSLMSYDYEPKVLSDIHHVVDLERQTKTVASTRIGYNGKRMWRIFNGQSTVSDKMFLEDYIRQTEEAGDEDIELEIEMEKKWREELAKQHTVESGENSPNLQSQNNQQTQNDNRANNAENNIDPFEKPPSPSVPHLTIGASTSSSSSSHTLLQQANPNYYQYLSSIQVETQPDQLAESGLDKLNSQLSTLPLELQTRQQQIATVSHRMELRRRAQLNVEIQQGERDREDLIFSNELKRSHPKLDQMMCFNPFTFAHQKIYNDITQICHDHEEPGQWWDSKDKTSYHRIGINYGVDQDPSEEESHDGNWKQFSKGSWQEFKDSIAIHQKKLMRDFSLGKDDPWPVGGYHGSNAKQSSTNEQSSLDNPESNFDQNVSYGWSVSPTVWFKNAIYGINVPTQCLNKMISWWDDHNVANVPIASAKDLKKTLPRTTIMRDLVIPIKLDKIEAKFHLFGTNDNASGIDHITSLRNETISRLCTEREKRIIDQIDGEEQQVHNGNNGHNLHIPDQILAAACQHQKDLVEMDNKERDIEHNHHYDVEQRKEQKRKAKKIEKQREELATLAENFYKYTTGLPQPDSPRELEFKQNERNADDAKLLDNEEDEIINQEVNVEMRTFDPSAPRQQLDWSFPTISLDSHIQHRIDTDPKFNFVRVLAGMNWYGYMYESRGSGREPGDLNNDEKNDSNGNSTDELMNQKNKPAPFQPHNPNLPTPIAVNSKQVREIITKWKGQIDLKHDLASGERFFVLRDGPDNHIVKSIWYPSFRQLHRKLHNVRSIADGIAIWECGQGTEGFEKLI